MYRVIILSLILSIFLNSQLSAQEDYNIPVLNFQELAPLLKKSNDTTYIINFWATWCVPCRKELPEFEKIHTDFSKTEKVKVILVSLDFASKINSSLIPFLEKNNITAPVVLLSDPNSNSWINKVDATWSGALPATVIYKNDQRRFFEEELTYSIINQTINQLNEPKN